jgi:hypothetical protein
VEKPKDTFDEMQQAREILYKISDINEVSIKYLEAVNGMESNQVITVLSQNRQLIENLGEILGDY